MTHIYQPSSPRIGDFDVNAKGPFHFVFLFSRFASFLHLCLMTLVNKSCTFLICWWPKQNRVCNQITQCEQRPSGTWWGGRNNRTFSSDSSPALFTVCMGMEGNCDPLIDTVIHQLQSNFYLNYKKYFAEIWCNHPQSDLYTIFIFPGTTGRC